MHTSVLVSQAAPAAGIGGATPLILFCVRLCFWYTILTHMRLWLHKWLLPLGLGVHPTDAASRQSLGVLTGC